MMRYDPARVREAVDAVRLDPAVESAALPMLEALAGEDGKVSVGDAVRVLQALLDETLSAVRSRRGREEAG